MGLESFQPPKKNARPVAESFKRQQEDTSMLSLRLDAALHKKLKLRSAERETSMTELLEELLREHL